MILYEGVNLEEGHSLWSRNREYEAKLETDGNLVIYKAGNKVWSSNTSDLPNEHPFRLTLESNGQLIIYDKNDNKVWSVGKDDVYSSYKVEMTNDGSLAIFADGSRVWESGRVY